MPSGGRPPGSDAGQGAAPCGEPQFSARDRQTGHAAKYLQRKIPRSDIFRLFAG